jgi:uncharacterized C2H2 Zn-finger protein
MSDNISDKDIRKIMEEQCKFCEGVCINNCKEKILKRLCPRCGVHIEKSSSYHRHINRQVPCVIDTLIDKKKRELGIVNKEIRINIKYSNNPKQEIRKDVSNESSEDYIGEYNNDKNNMINMLVDKFEKNLSERISKENELVKQLKEKEEEINKIKNNNKNYYENRVKLILENELENGDIEILKRRILDEKDMNVLKNLLHKIKKYNNSIKQYFEKEFASYTSLWTLRTKTEKEIENEKESNMGFYNKIKIIFSEEDRSIIEELINENIDSEKENKKLLYF